MVGIDRHRVVAAVRNVPRANCRRMDDSNHLAGNSFEEANLFNLELSGPPSLLLIIQKDCIESFAKGVPNQRSSCA